MIAVLAAFFEGLLPVLGCEVADMLILNTLEYGALGFGVEVLNLEMGFTSAISAAIIFHHTAMGSDSGSGEEEEVVSSDTTRIWDLEIRCGLYS